ncbi:8736_t:CDS:2 [Gigaspora margarita]|uniref:8736_t:CDS:1 n=1 Tax=Gigaspora margarita TaxID=4874 RepID=A0ABN7VI52_GIGMA|nr:8736_t:CDS:2 [Gigaspora margarita]
MKKREKELKEKFYSSPFAERAKIKRELTALQEEIMSIDIKHEEMIQRLENPTDPATDPHHLVELIKKELREVLDGSRKFEAGDEEINELIANLARNRQKPLDRDKITTRMVRVRQEDFSSADFDEMISLIRQVKNFLEEQNRQDQQRKENIKLNNPHLFTQDEIISEAEAQKLTKEDKEYYIKYETYVELNDKIFIDHYQENGQQELANPVSGVNGLIENTNDKNMSSGLITNGVEKDKTPKEIDNEFLLKFFQSKNIKQISLTPEGNLLIEYNSGKSEIVFNEQANNQELQKVISYYRNNNQTNLSQQDLINMNGTNSPTEKPKDNKAI